MRESLDSNPGLLTPSSGKQAAALISQSCCPTMCQGEGKTRRGAAPRGPSSEGRLAAGRRNSSGWLVLMLEECLEKPCLSLCI